MTKIEYRCNKCLIIEEEWTFHSDKPSDSIHCRKCGGLAYRLPSSNSKEEVLEDFQEARDHFN